MGRSERVAMLVRRGFGRSFSGIEQADSVAFDFHKWMTGSV